MSNIIFKRFLENSTHSAFLSVVLVQIGFTALYYGTQTLLVLYLIYNFHLTPSQSYTLYGGFVALLFLLPSFGGFIADRYTGPVDAFLVGSGLGMIGVFLLSLKSSITFASGLAFLMLGVGLAKSTSLSIVGFLYRDDLLQKEKSYRLLYLAVNIGATLGPVIFGVTIYSWGWHAGFIMSGLGQLVVTLLFAKYVKALKQIMPSKSYDKRICLFLVPMIALITMLFSKPEILNFFIALSFLISLIYFARIFFKESGLARKQILNLFILSGFGMFYYIAGMQIGSTIAVFIQEKINLDQINFHFPASMFSSLYTVFIIFFAPLINWIWKGLAKKKITLTLTQKLSFGILTGGLGLITFALATLTLMPLKLIITGIGLLSLGELILAPAIYTAISTYSPLHLKTSMMGCWLLFVALGGYLSSIITHGIIRFTVNNNHTDFNVFFFSGVLVLAGAVLLLALRKKINFASEVKSAS